MDLGEIWRIQQSAPFPQSALGRSIGEWTLLKIDAEVGAALTASLRTDGVPRRLPPARAAALRHGLDLIRTVLSEEGLLPDTREYFERLRTLSLAVLAATG